MIFDSEYTKYWMSTVDKSIDGTEIPGVAHANYFLAKIPEINRNSIIIDIGCSYGRIFEALNYYSSNIHGIDLDPSALELAKKHDYISLHEAFAEQTPFASDFADLIFAFLIFDVLDQTKFLLEASRILKSGGYILLTGTSDNYDLDDSLALDAERNSYRKNFPKKFTNVPELIRYLGFIGFDIVEFFTFKRRGNFGIFQFSDSNKVDSELYIFYEFVIIAKKVKANKDINCPDFSVSSKHSKTALTHSLLNGFQDVDSFF